MLDTAWVCVVLGLLGGSSSKNLITVSYGSHRPEAGVCRQQLYDCSRSSSGVVGTLQTSP